MKGNTGKGHGFRIYKDYDRPLSKSSSSARTELYSDSKTLIENKQMEVALLRKLHNKTKVVGFLKYKGEIKGIRFYDPTNRKFIDIAPWHLSQFNMSKLKLMEVREIELIRHEAGESEGTIVIEFLTKHELMGHFKANRMITDQLAQALSGILNYMPEEEYQNVLKNFQTERS